MKKRLPLIALVFGYLLYSLLSYRQFGITNDEPEDYLLGSYLYTKLRADDPVLERSFVDKNDSINLAFYDRIYMAGQYAVVGEINYSMYHLINLLAFMVMLVFSYELLLKTTKKPAQALIGPLFLLLTPRLFGDAAANHKDIPFAVSYFISLALTYWLAAKNRAKYLLVLGLFFGLSQSLRSVGFTIYILYLLWTYVQSKGSILQKIATTMAQTAVVFCIGLLVHFVTLPYLAADPLSRFGELFSIAKAFPWSGEVLFNGQLIAAPQLPWTYLPIWFVITTPIFVMFLLLVSLRWLKQSQLIVFLWLALVVNIAIIFMNKPVVYDGLRHVLFLLPIVSTLASLSLLQMLQHRWKWKRVTFIALGLNAVLVVLQYVLLFPYHYTYFNELVGYLPGANSRFELDYWGASYKAAVEQFNTVADSDQTYHLYSCGDPQQIAEYATFNYERVPKPEEANLLICHRRGKNQTMIDAFNAASQFSVSREGVPLTVVQWR